MGFFGNMKEALDQWAGNNARMANRNSRSRYDYR